MNKTVLTYSATGVQGNPMARAFVQAGFQTRTITRNPDSEAAQALATQGIDVQQGDMGNLDQLKVANEGVDVVALLIPFFVPPPNNPMTYLQNVVAAAKHAGVKLIVWNTSGPMLEERVGRQMVDYRHDFYDILQDSGIPTIAIAPGAYMENLMGPWTAQGIITQGELTYPIPDGERLSWITTQDVAQLVVEAAQHPELAGEIIRVSGPENLTGTDMAERFSRALNRPIQWRKLTPREFGDQIAQFMGPEAGDGLAEDYTFMNENMKRVMAYHDMEPILAKLPVILTTLENWVQQHAFAFQDTQES